MPGELGQVEAGESHTNLQNGIITSMGDQAKVLIAEDDHFLSSLLKARLEKEGFLVRLAFNGEEALHALKEFTPHVIVLDLIMPRVSGFEVL